MKLFKKLFFITVCAFYCNTYSQTYEIDANDGQTITTCTGMFTDSRANSDYYNNENYTVTFCSGSATEVLQFIFNPDDTDSAFNENNFEIRPGDVLYVYDGTDTSGTLITTITDTSDPGGSHFYVNGISECVTFNFISDSSGDDNGWKALISCVPIGCGTNPSPADDFLNAPYICDLDGFCATTVGYTEDFPANLTDAGGNCPGPLFGGTIENNSWIQFEAASTSITLEFTVPVCYGAFGVVTPGTSDGIQSAIFEYDGTNFTRVSDCAVSDGTNNETFILSSTSLVVGNTYYIMTDGSAGSQCDYYIKVLNGGAGVALFDAGPDQTICSGNSATLTASGPSGATYSWTSTEAGFGTVVGNIISVSPTSTATYTVEVTEGGLCTNDIDTVGVIVDTCGCATTSTWDGTNWSANGVPDITDNVIINGNYNTLTDGNIIACNLTINSTYSLTVTNAAYIQVQNDVTVNGDLVVETKGALVQIDDSSTFTLNPGGTAIVNKTTTLLSNWYDYTYWSSPVESETVNDAFSVTPANRRFVFNTANYLDEFIEINNDNSNTTLGQDDIDDNSDDWQIAAGESFLTPGVGYAATYDPNITFPLSYPLVGLITFSGPFNTGIINTPIIINGFALDNDWNFIGNPYPSAIDFDDVYAANMSVIDGAAYLWSHATPPSLDANGNEVINFSQNDYAIITVGSGNAAGGDTVIPVSGNFIPSGQGFFVKGILGGNLTFNNIMRRADTSSNDQFFRTSNSSYTNANRLWVNLTSDNGVFNQILVAYVDGATNGNDGWSYDAPRNLSSGITSVIYTSIVGNEEKYAIQGKAPSSLTFDERIPLGFKTNIDLPTLYKFSIAQLEGDFVETNTIYLKDNYLGIIYNLSDSDYSFTSDSGEYNDRFEIVFTMDSLAIDDTVLGDNKLEIIELENNNIKFTVSNNQTIKTIKIYDVLGRLIYDLNGNTSSETYTLSNIRKTVYFVKVELGNGKIITKKAIKRN